MTDKKEETLVHPLTFLAEVDKLLLAGSYLEAGNLLIRFLVEQETIWEKRDYGQSNNHGDRLNTYAEVAERASNQWRLVLMSGADLTQLNLLVLIKVMYPLHLMLMGSWQGHMDDVIVTQHNLCGGSYSPERLLRLLLAWCPASRVGIDIFAQYANAQELVLAHALATVGGMALVSEPANTARNRAIDLLNNEQLIADETLLKFDIRGRTVTGCWMRCSYAEHPQKHQVKKLLMRLSRLWLAREYADAPPGEVVSLSRHDGNKPLLVLPLESFAGNHAMYRCYAPVLQALRQSFYLVGLCTPGCYDEDTKGLFDEFFDLDAFGLGGGCFNLASLEASIRSWQPAGIYYPSVGMVDWVQQLSMRRLAPVQMMTLGHPATSLSPEMDYVLMDEAFRGQDAAPLAACFSEKIAWVPPAGGAFVMRPDAIRIQPLENLPEDGVIRIAIPSVAQKLSAGFISCLRKLEEACPGKVHFVFFLGERSLQAVACFHQLRRELKEAEYHLQMDYNDYIREINRCQLHACSFPFGGTNSLVDSLRQGLPILALEGDELHARVDASFVRLVGLPESLVCHTEDEYTQRLIELVNHPEELQKLHHYLLHEVDVDKKLLHEGDVDGYRKTILALVEGGVK